MDAPAPIAKGALGGGVFQTSDCGASYEELKAKGVTFLWNRPIPRTAWSLSSATTRATWFSLTQAKAYSD